MEKGGENLRKILKEEKVEIEERKKIAEGIKNGMDYLEKIGIVYCDLKMENVLMVDGIPKIIDFGLVCERSGRSGYQKMGYARKGSKFRNQESLCKFILKLNLYFLVAATPGFAYQWQYTSEGDYLVRNLFYYLFCDWKTGWTLLYKPISENERKEIDEIIKVSKSLKRAEFKFYSEMQCVFDPQNKRRRLFNHLRNHVDHLNSILIFYFLPRRPKSDKIGQCFNFETKRDEISQQRSSKRDAKRD